MRFKTWLEGMGQPFYKPVAPVAQLAPASMQGAWAPRAIPTSTVQNTLNTDTDAMGVVKQYLDAFERRLDSGMTDQASVKQMIDANVRQIASRYKQQAGEFFRTKANNLYQQYMQLQAAMQRRGTGKV